MRTLLLCLVCYLLGGFCAGYYWVRLRDGRDVRETGSGSTGARNVGRLLGRGAFLATVFLDAAKGALAIALAVWFGAGAWGTALALLAVVAGHVVPIQLQWRGGKGVATALGGLLAWAIVGRFAVAPAVALTLLLPALVLWAHRSNLRAAFGRTGSQS